MQNINLQDSSEEIMRNLVTSQQPLIEKIYLLQDKFGETFINAATDITGYGFIGHLKDCLLYTSPSPRDGLLSRMPSSA